MRLDTKVVENRKKSNAVVPKRELVAGGLTKSHRPAEKSDSNGVEQQSLACSVKENTMSENYPEQLAERLRAKNSAGRSLNKAAFLAAKADVVSALEAGFVPKDIWGDLRTCKRINFSYDTFLRLVKQLTSSSPVAHPSLAVPVRKTAIVDSPGSLPAVSVKPAKSPGFVFNPCLKIEDLF